MGYDPEDLGYRHFRCPQCCRSQYADGEYECAYCGWTEHREPEPELADCLLCKDEFAREDLTEAGLCENCQEELDDLLEVEDIPVQDALSQLKAEKAERLRTRNERLR